MHFFLIGRYIIDLLRLVSLGVQLMAQHASKYDHIIWINAASLDHIDASYTQVAKKMDIPWFGIAVLHNWYKRD